MEITQVAERHWHALEDDLVVGRGDAWPRPDGRLFLSVDVWHDAVFDRLAAAMLAGLPRPLYTVVDQADTDLTTSWHRAGFTTRRREWECLVPTAPATAPPPAGVTIVPLGGAEERPLRRLDRTIRAEIDWAEMPAEMLARLDPTKYAAAAVDGHYVGLVRVVALTRLPRIGPVAVRADHRRRGIARALLAHVLGTLHDAGIGTASVEVNESNAAGTALFDGVGARRAGSNLELVSR